MRYYVYILDKDMKKKVVTWYHTYEMAYRKKLAMEKKYPLNVYLIDEIKEES